MVKRQAASRAKKATPCAKQTTKRYTKESRGAPPYPGTACCGKTKRGNDGEKYKAEPIGDGKACAWKRVHKMTTRSLKKGTVVSKM